VEGGNGDGGSGLPAAWWVFVVGRGLKHEGRTLQRKRARPKIVNAIDGTHAPVCGDLKRRGQRRESIKGNVSCHQRRSKGGKTIKRKEGQRQRRLTLQRER
jgi:hypothetical protein